MMDTLGLVTAVLAVWWVASAGVVYGCLHLTGADRNWRQVLAGWPVYAAVLAVVFYEAMQAVEIPDMGVSP